MVAVCQKTTTASTSMPTAMIVSPMAGRSEPAPPSPCAPPFAMSAEPELLEDAFDAHGLLVEEFLELVAEERDDGPVPGLAGFGPLRRCHHLLDQRQHRLPLVGVHAGRREHAAPIEQLDVDAFLLQRRGIDALLALVGRDREQPQLAGLDLLGELAVAGNA